MLHTSTSGRRCGDKKPANVQEAPFQAEVRFALDRFVCRRLRLGIFTYRWVKSSISAKELSLWVERALRRVLWKRAGIRPLDPKREHNSLNIRCWNCCLLITAETS